jgi:heme exporter protein C
VTIRDVPASAPVPQEQTAVTTQSPDESVSRRRPSILGIVTAVSLVVFVYMAFFFAPEDANMGPVQRIFYIHVPSAWISMVAFGVVFVSSIIVLVKHSEKADRFAEAAASIGVLFTTVVLVTGMMWGHAEWGVYWTWDPRLTSYLVLWLMYLAYIALRSYVPDPARKARFAAVVAIIAFLDVPIVYLSTVWFRTLHPRIFTENGDNGLPPAMLVALMTGIVTFTLVFAYLVRLRLEVTSLQTQVEEIES